MKRASLTRRCLAPMNTCDARSAPASGPSLGVPRTISACRAQRRLSVIGRAVIQPAMLSLASLQADPSERGAVHAEFRAGVYGALTGR